MITFSNNLTVREYKYQDWKTALALKGGIPQYDASQGQVTQIWFYDGPEVNLCVLWQIPVPQDIIDGGYTQAQNDTDTADFVANYQSNCNQAIEPKLADGRARMSSEKTNQSRITFYSPNWCDKTTWYPTSVYVASETVSLDDSDGYYHLAHPYVIDSYHGKITTEDSLKDSSGHSYRVAVKVNGATKTEQDPHYGTGGDYLVDYVDGYIMPISWTPVDSDTLVATYHYAISASVTISPASGKQLLINMAECQFSTDVIMNDTATFTVNGYAGVFAPQLGYPYNTLIPLTSFKYKTMNDLFNDACRSYPVYPPLGGAGWRGMSCPSTVLDWDYVSATTLNSASGMQVVITLDHNAEFGGTYATVTFYCTSE